MAKKLQRPKPPKPLCPYCCEREGTTVDHVIAKCFITDMPVVGTFTVKACQTCNVEKSQCEDYLADILQSSALATQHPVAREKSERVIRSAEKHASQLVRELAERFGPLTQEQIDAIPDEGVFSHTFEWAKIERAIQFIVRGLYAHYCRPHRLPKDARIQVKRIPEWQMYEILPMLCQQTPIGPHIIGRMVTIVRYNINPNRPIESLWLIVFYQSIVFPVLTSAANDPTSE